MGFFRYNTDPKKKQAKLNVSLSASPTPSISEPTAVIRLTVTVSIASTKGEHAKKPLTLCTDDSVLEERVSGEGGIDIFARRGFTSLLTCPLLWECDTQQFQQKGN